MTWNNWSSTAETKKKYLQAADEVAPTKPLTSLLKLALYLMDRIFRRKRIP